jgi:type VII secretion integral membrane protein EccD
MSQAVAPVRGLVRLSITSDDRRLDVGVPSLVPLVELIPGFARSLGVLDPTLAQAGYALRRADGSVLDPAKSSVAQGLQDGELLTLVPGGLVGEARIYDDIVEAVVDASSEQHRPWTPRDSARTALAISLTFLGLCAVFLASAGPANLIGALVAGGAALVLLTTAAVLSRVEQREAAHAFGLAAALFGALSGFLAVPAGPLAGWPVAAAGAAALLVGGIAMILLRPAPEIHLLSMASGATAAIAGTLTALLPESAVAVAALTIAVGATLANALPWLALSSTRIRVISPQSDADVFAPPSPIDAVEVRRRAAAGQRLLLALRLALGLVIVAATLQVAAASPVGALLCALAFVGMLFQSRQIQARSGVLAVMVLGALGLAVTGLVVSSSHPDLRPALLVLLLAVTAVLVTVTLLSPRARIRLGRLADTIEVVVLASLLPLGVLSAGLA